MQLKTNYLVAVAALVLWIALCLAPVYAQTAGTSCTAAQCNQMVVLGNPTQFVMCNSNCSTSGVWTIAKQIGPAGLGIAAGTTSVVPHAALDVNGPMKISDDPNGCRSTCSNAGELCYYTSKTLLLYCTGSFWTTFNSALPPSVSCPQHGSYNGAQNQVLMIAAGCGISFQAWGGGGGGGGGSASIAGGPGGGAGYETVSVSSSASLQTFYISVGGGGGGGAIANGMYGFGGSGATGFNGGNSWFWNQGGGGGGGATGVWTSGFGGGTPVLVAAGGAGGASAAAAGGTSIFPGNPGGISVGTNATAPVTSGGNCVVGNNSNGGGGGGYPYGGSSAATANGGQNYPSSGGTAGTGQTPANAGGLSGAGVSGAGYGGNGGAASTTSTGSSGADGAIYWATCTAPPCI